MKLLISYALIFFGGLLCSDPPVAYICNSKNAKKYHLVENCKGLNICTYKTVKTTIEHAKKQGKTLCGWEK